MKSARNSQRMAPPRVRRGRSRTRSVHSWILKAAPYSCRSSCGSQQDRRGQRMASRTRSIRDSSSCVGKDRRSASRNRIDHHRERSRRSISTPEWDHEHTAYDISSTEEGRFLYKRETPSSGPGLPDGRSQVMKGTGCSSVTSTWEPSDIIDTELSRKHDIDVVGIDSNTICYQSTLGMLQKLQLKREKRQWNGRIIVGGPHTSVGHGDIPEYVDHIVIGEGEASAPRIISGEISDRVVIWREGR